MGEVALVKCQLKSTLCIYSKLFQKIGSKIYQINKKLEQKKFGKSKLSYYDVIRQILQFAPKFV